MHVLLTGATGFIGRALAQRLLADGHAVSAAGRSARGLPAGARWIAADFTRDHAASDWRARLAGVEAVVNAVGILRESSGQRFDALHVHAPRALFTACVQAGVRRVLQVSALGADAQARSAHHTSKREADQFLLQQPLSAVVVQPSLVYGVGGASAALFNTLASLPVVPLPGDGRMAVQPIHLDDLIDALHALLTDEDWRTGRVALVGPQPLSLHAYLAELRGALGLPPARVVAVPLQLVRVAARVSAHLPGALLDADALAMLERGNAAPADDTTVLLGHPPRPVRAFVPPDLAPTVLTAARWTWLAPLLHLALAVVWIGTAWVSLVSFPQAESHALLARAGVPRLLQAPALWGAALLDLALGVLTLAATWLTARQRRALWWAQIALMAGYSVVIALRLPEFWVHPYGPMLKNIVILAVLMVLLAMEPPRVDGASGARR